MWEGNAVYLRLKLTMIARIKMRAMFPCVRPFQVYTTISDIEEELDGFVTGSLQTQDHRDDDFARSRATGWRIFDTFLGRYVSPEDMANIWQDVSFHFECAQSLYYGLKKANDFQDFWIATSQYFRAVTGKGVIEAIGIVSNKIQGWIEVIIDMITTELQSNDERVDTNPFARLRSWLTKYESLRDHPIVVRLRKVFLYIMSFSMLERFGITFSTFYYEKAEEEYIKSKHKDSGDFLYTVMEGTSFILERLYDCHKTGTWSPIIHSGKNYGAWVDEIYYLKENAQKLHNPEANGFSYHEYVGRVKSAIEKGEAICKYTTDLSASDKMLLKRLLSDVRLIDADLCTKAAARQSRHSPFSLLYYGGSGIGKSTLLNLTFSHFGKTFDLPIAKEYHYTRTADSEYWSGFQTSVWSLVLDDIAAQNPNMGPDESMGEILQIVNNIPYTPPQADLADKGRTPVRVELVQATTNTKGLNASAYYCNQLAILRRFPIVVTPTIKAEFAINPNADPRERMLDSSKCPPLAEGEYPDYWNLQVQLVKPRLGSDERQYAEYFDVRPHGFTCIYDFLAWISEQAVAHKANQQLMDASEQKYRAATVCKQCFRPAISCICELAADIQSSEITTTLVVTSAFMIVIYQAYLWVRNWVMRHGVQAVERTIVWILQRLKWQKIFAQLGRTAVNTAIETARDETTDLYADITQKVRMSALSLQDRLKMEATLMREHCVRIGNNIRGRSISSNILLGTICALPLVAGAYKMYTAFQKVDLQSSWEEGSRLEAKDEKPNPWYRDDYKVSEFDVGMLTSSWKALSEEQVMQKVHKNCAYAAARYQRDGEGKIRPMRLLCLGGNLYVTNNHNIPDLPEMQLDIHLRGVEQGVGSSFGFRLVTSSVYRVPEEDLVFFRIPCVPPKANMIDLIPGKNFKTQCNGVLLGRNDLGQPEQMLLRGLRRASKSTELGAFESWLATVRQNTVTGQCGSPVLGFTPSGPMILGLHQTGGYNLAVSSVCLTRETVERAIEYFKRPIIQAGTPNLTDVEGRPIPLQPLHHKSTFRYLETGVADVYGTLPGFRGGGKSKVTKTAIHDACVQRGYEVTTAAPVMKGYQPWRHAVKDVVEQQFTIDQSVLDECVGAFATDIIDSLPEKDLAELVTLDNESTLNGLPGVKFIDKMNRKTSMGFPWRKKKSHYLELLGEVDMWQDYAVFGEDFYARVDEIIAKYEDGVRHCPIFINHLKDEPQKKSKVKEGKTRVFSGGPADWSFVVRKYLLTFVRVVQNNKFLFESCPGTNATSAEWDLIYHHLTQFGKDRVVAGDYSKFDKKMTAQMILAAFEVIDAIMIKSGRSERERRIIQAIGYDIAFPVSDVNGDLVQFWGSNPSGHPLTVIINGLVNSLYVRYCWKLAGNNLAEFKRKVALLTYGDDNIMNIERSVINFDHTVLVKHLATIGVVYTMADKEAASVPFVDISDVTFLKRGWRYEPELGSHVAQLEHDSIAKSLTMHLPSSEVCAEAKAVESMTNALHEYFYYGRQEFENRRDMFLDIVRECELEPFMLSEFPDFDTLKAQYLNASEDYYPGGMCPTCSAA